MVVDATRIIASRRNNRRPLEGVARRCSSQGWRRSCWLIELETLLSTRHDALAPAPSILHLMRTKELRAKRFLALMVPSAGQRLAPSDRRQCLEHPRVDRLGEEPHGPIGEGDARPAAVEPAELAPAPEVGPP